MNEEDKKEEKVSSRRYYVTLNEYADKKLQGIIANTGESGAGLLSRVFNLWLKTSTTFKDE